MHDIVIIEDDIDLLENIELILSRENFSTISFKSGMDYLNRAQNIEPKLIICDVMLPGLDGFEILRTLQKNIKNFNTPFVFLTGKTENENLRKGMNLGAADYLTKPFQKDELINVVKLRSKKTALDNEDENKDKDLLDIDNFVLLPVGKSYKNVALKNIEYITSNGVYTTVKLNEGKSFLTKKLLKDWEKILPQNYFVRIHKSTIINLEFVLKLEKWFNNSYIVNMKNYKDKLPISRRYLSKIRQKLIL